ncbi:MAG: DUF1273 family protein [Clostridia bacterium]|nr:DUF1273 family protein [Clostridia bacterium]
MSDPQISTDMTRDNTCLFTGHRAIAESARSPLYADLLRCILKLHGEGIRYFLSGGAIGFDMLAAGAVLQAKRFSKDIHLVLVLPCRNQTERWMRVNSESAVANLQAYQHLKDEADSIVYVSDLYYDGCMRDRNAKMIEMGSRCIAYWNGSGMGGTAQTVRMAKKANIPLINLW